MTIHVVIGPPCSGKSTYIREHARDGEVRIDLDDMAQALGSKSPHDSKGAIRSAAISARAAAIKRCMDDGADAWIAHTSPTDEQMKAYEDAGAEVTTMDADEETCLKRAEDEGRPSWTFRVIREWFGKHPDEDKRSEMPFNQGRQYRTFPASRFAAVDDDSRFQGGYVVEGYATTFDQPYELYRDEDGPIYEVIDSHALDDADMTDVIVQYDHSGMVLARQRNRSLFIEPRPQGLYSQMQLNGCQQARDMYEGIQSGLIDRMSWGFVIADNGWSYDPQTRTSTITAVRKVFDVSAVSRPANENTTISARSYLDGVIEARRQELSRRASEQRRRDNLLLLLRIATD